MIVTFDHPWLLILLLLLPGLWLWMRAQPSSSRLCIALKCVSCAALVIALAGPIVPKQSTKLAVAVLVDTTASMPSESRQRGEAMIRDLIRRRSGADLSLITF